MCQPYAQYGGSKVGIVQFNERDELPRRPRVSRCVSCSVPLMYIYWSFSCPFDTYIHAFFPFPLRVLGLVFVTFVQVQVFVTSCKSK